MKQTSGRLLEGIKCFAETLEEGELLLKCGYENLSEFYTAVLYAKNPALESATTKRDKAILDVVGRILDYVSTNENAVIEARFENDQALYLRSRHIGSNSISVFMAREDSVNENQFDIEDCDSYTIDAEGVQSALLDFLGRIFDSDGEICDAFNEDTMIAPMFYDCVEAYKDAIPSINYWE